ncbi:MAG: trigger factor [Fidelibacterota bacterium]
MNINVKDINSYTREVAVELPWEEISDDFEAFVKKFSRRVKLPGFRPGKVPRKVLMQKFQPAIEAEFVEDSVNQYYYQALQEKDLMPVNKASVSDIHFHYGKHFHFKTTFEVEPEIVLPKLKKNSLKVERTRYIIDETDVDLALEDMRRSNVEVQTVEDGAEEGDYVIGDLQSLDQSGVPIIGQKLETRYLHLGEGTFTGENLQRLTGVKPGDKARISVPLDEQGNLGTFEVNVKNVERQIPPELNEDFVRAVDPEAKDLNGLRSRTKERLTEAYEQRSTEALDRQLSDAMIDLTNPEFPPSMVDSYLERMVAEMIKSGDQKLDKAKIKEVYREAAERNLKWYLIRKAIIRDQNFEVSDEAVTGEIQRLKAKNPDQGLEVEKYYRKPSNRSRLKDDLLENKILAYLKEFAKIREQKVLTQDLRKKAEEEEKQK